MCLAIPGKVIDFVAEMPQLAVVEVSGVKRQVNVDLLRDEPLGPGDWVLIHVGFAMSRISEAAAEEQMRMLAMLGEDLQAMEDPGLRWMRDPTRGGVATALNELARDSGLGIVLHEEEIPVREAVRGACELLGLDPLHIANEGQFLAVVAPEQADEALAAVRAVPGGGEAVIIGEVREQPARTVLAAASYGGTRVVDMLVGDPLPRIC